MTNDLTHNKRRISSGLRLIDTWEQNIKFFKSRIELQEDGKVDATTRKYSQLDIDIEQEKIDKAKDILQGIGYKFENV